MENAKSILDRETTLTPTPERLEVMAAAKACVKILDTYPGVVDGQTLSVMVENHGENEYRAFVVCCVHVAGTEKRALESLGQTLLGLAKSKEDAARAALPEGR